jgi:hypothetical protein
MQQLINITPHALNIHGVGGNVISIPPSGVVARLSVSREARPTLTVDSGFTIGVVKPTLGQVQDLPPPSEGITFVASALVAEAARRPDVMSPGELVRDTAGVITGCKGLCAYV